MCTSVNLVNKYTRCEEYLEEMQAELEYFERGAADCIDGHIYI